MNTSKIWNEELRELVLQILSEPKTVYGYSHRPFMTTYQLALAVKKNRPDIFETAGKTLGGKGAGHNTFAAYLGKAIMDNFSPSQPDSLIEYAFLSHDYLVSIQFEDNVESSLIASKEATVMFRLKE